MVKKIKNTASYKKLQKTIENQKSQVQLLRKDLKDLKRINARHKASLLKEKEIKKSIRDLTKALDIVQSDKAYTKKPKPKGSGGTAEDLSKDKYLIKKKALYSRRELVNLLELDETTMQRAERQGLVVPINIYNNVWKDLRARDGEVYAIKLSKEQMDSLKTYIGARDFSPETKKIYLGENIRDWMDNRFVEKTYKSPTGGSYKRKVIKGLTATQYKKNFNKWSEIFDDELEKILPDFHPSQKVKNGVKEYSYTKDGSKSKGFNFR